MAKGTLPLTALLMGSAFLLCAGVSQPPNVPVFAALFGTTAYLMYPVVVAHAEPGTYILISGGLLLVFGDGWSVGTTNAGFAMTFFGAASLSAITRVAHIPLILFAVLRLMVAPWATAERNVAFQAQPLARPSTPEMVAFAAVQAEMDADQPPAAASKTTAAEKDRTE